MAEGWRKKNEEKAESNKRMENCWNMVGLVGWWRRVEKENLRRINDHEKKQEEGVRKSSDRKSQSSANFSFIKKFFPDKEDEIGPDLDENEPDTKLLSTPSRSIPDVAILLTTGSKWKREYLSGGIIKTQKVSLSIA